MQMLDFCLTYSYHSGCHNHMVTKCMAHQDPNLGLVDVLSITEQGSQFIQLIPFGGCPTVGGVISYPLWRSLG